jgi:anti-sigma regulatory factor (Ser/Thr protein kinase)
MTARTAAHVPVSPQTARGGPVLVAAILTGSSIEVEITDDGTGRPHVAEPSTTAIGGRGLLLVEQIAAAWGVRPSASGLGKTVWFRLPV